MAEGELDVSAGGSDGRVRAGDGASLLAGTGGRKRADWEREVAVEFLSIVNANAAVEGLVNASVRFFRKHSGCEAVGIRLREGEDYPYYETHGFPEQFVRMESSLCSRDATGEIQRDKVGNPILACMCGNVICGRVDPSKPFFSPTGSFWTNSTSQLLATTTEADRQTRTRNRCNGMGYESVALLALRVGEQTLGLLQLNDGRRSMFTAESIALWERLAGFLAIALAHARAADALRKSEARFRALVMASSDALYRTSPDWREVHLLRGPHVIADKDAPIGNLFEQYILADDRPRMETAIGEAIRTRSTLKLEHRVLRPDGSVGWMSTRAAPLLDAGGKIIEWFGATSDITERKQAEEALQASESRYRALFDHAMDAVFLTVPDGRVLAANPAACALFGMTEAEIIQAGRQGLIDPSDDRHAVALAERARVGHARVELRFMRKDGTRFTAEVESVILGKDMNRSFVVLRDITARKAMEQALRRSEERFRAVFEKAPTGIVLTNEEGRFLECNPAFCALLGYSEDELCAMHFPALLHPEHREADMQDRTRLLAGRIAYFEKDSRYIRKSGEAVWVHKLVSRLPGPGGETRVLVLAVDITERKRTEQQLQAARVNAEQAKAEAEAANQAKDQFLARLSHELRTPLTPVLLAVTQWQARDDVPAGLREDLAMMRRNLELEARLLEDLLDVNRILHGKLPLRRETIDVHTKITRAVEILNADIQAKRIRVRLQLQAERCCIEGDAARMQQVFWNLLSNAVKFTPEGGSITIRSGNDGSEQIRIEVIDNGRGIEPELLPRVFQPFEQGGHTTTFQYGGLGLGLAICRAVVLLHDGTIVAQSEGLDRGTTMTVRLNTIPTPALAASPVGVRPGPAKGQGRQVLLVEDHPDTAKLLARLVRNWGHTVRIAHSVAEALKAADEPFDLLISDLGLPDGNGHELMRQLSAEGAARGRSFKAIAVSGFGMEEDQQRSREVGFFTHLTKPVNPATLKAAIAEACRWE